MSFLKKLIKLSLLFVMALLQKLPFLPRMTAAFLSLCPPLKRRLAGMFQAHSALVNAPLRTIPKGVAKKILLGMMNFAFARPKLKNFCIRMLKRTPALSARLRRLLLNQAGPTNQAVFLQIPEQLSPIAQRYYDRLQVAIKRAKETSCE